jgi:NAD(P)-dependent dehydrogenase (short-subunit alcohol dehydrogenase family)
MGLYAITGGTKGIGLEAAKCLRAQGHDIINIDIDGGDITVDLGTKEGRRTAIDELHKRCPDGLDGLLCNAGIAGAPKFSTVLSVNYFGAVALAEGVYDLLKLKRGNCVVTVSGSIAYITRDKYYVDELLVNCGDEERISRLVDSFDPEKIRNTMYGSTKIALVRWVRRTAPSWAVHGVNLNAVAPGAVATTIMKNIGDGGLNLDLLLSLAMPTVYRARTMMDPAALGPVLAFLATPAAKGCCGAVVYCDGGTSAVLHPEKFY